MSPPTGDFRRVVALLTAIEDENGPAVGDILSEFTRDDTLRMAAMYAESIRQQAQVHGLPMSLALQIFGSCAARHFEAHGGPA